MPRAADPRRRRPRSTDMTDTITVTGVVGSDPRVHVTSQGLTITSFRLASTRTVLRPHEGRVGGRRDQLVHRLRLPPARAQRGHVGAPRRPRGRPRPTAPARVGERREVRHRDRDRGRLDRTRPRLGHDGAHAGCVARVRVDAERPAPAAESGGWPGVEASPETPAALDGSDPADDIEGADGVVRRSRPCVRRRGARGHGVRLTAGHPAAHP